MSDEETETTRRGRVAWYDAWDELEKRWGFWSTSQVAYHTGWTTRAVLRSEMAGDLLGVQNAHGIWGFPGYQFDGPRIALAMGYVRRHMARAGWDDDSIALWMTSPQGACNGAIPAEILFTDPKLVVSGARAAADII